MENKVIPTIQQVSADERGEIYVVNLPDDRELVLLHSRVGSLRGGHSHNVDEIVVMLTGKMAYFKRDESGKEWREEVQAGDASFNPAGLIHMGEFLEDSWVMEWKLAKSKGERNNDYQPWRQKVTANAVAR